MYATESADLKDNQLFLVVVYVAFSNREGLSRKLDVRLQNRSIPEFCYNIDGAIFTEKETNKHDWISSTEYTIHALQIVFKPSLL